jgi:hypothetical protein
MMMMQVQVQVEAIVRLLSATDMSFIFCLVPHHLAGRTPLSLPAYTRKYCIFIGEDGRKPKGLQMFRVGFGQNSSELTPPTDI